MAVSLEIQIVRAAFLSVNVRYEQVARFLPLTYLADGLRDVAGDVDQLAGDEMRPEVTERLPRRRGKARQCC